jgi:hypothetical protein
MGEIWARSLFGNRESWLRSYAGIGAATAWGKDLSAMTKKCVCLQKLKKLIDNDRHMDETAMILQN